VKRPKTSRSLVLDSDEHQELYDLYSDSEEAMVTEAMLVDDAEMWGSEVGSPLGGVQVAEDGSSMDVDGERDDEGDI